MRVTAGVDTWMLSIQRIQGGIYMRINTNLMALNAQNKLRVNQSNVEKSIQKLSSGLRINSAADDASGLAISEKMRSQIRGLTQAQNNNKIPKTYKKLPESYIQAVFFCYRATIKSRKADYPSLPGEGRGTAPK